MLMIHAPRVRLNLPFGHVLDYQDEAFFEQGSRVHLRGASGSGKSQFLFWLKGLSGAMGIEASSQALYTSQIHPPFSAPPSAKSAALLMQSLSANFLCEHVRSELLLACRFLEKPNAQESMDEAIACFDLSLFLDCSIATLSAGQAKRLALACLWLQNPSVYLLDEPMAFLDAAHKKSIAQLINKRLDPSALVLICEHQNHDIHETDSLYFSSQTKKRVQSIAFSQSPQEGALFAEAPKGKSSNKSPPKPVVFLNAKDLVFAYPPQKEKKNRHTQNSAKGASNAPLIGGASLSLLQGEILGLSGENGSGKTTLLKLLCKMHMPQSGAVNAHACVRFLSHYAHRYLFEPTALDVLGGNTHYLPSDIHPQSQPLRLSEGQKRRLSIYALMNQGTGVMLLDEPTVGLDIDAQKALAQSMIALASEGVSFVVASHDNDFLRYVSHRRCVLSRGMIHDEEGGA